MFVEMYVRDVKEGTTLPDGQPVIDRETVSTALVNANNVLGPVSKLQSKLGRFFFKTIC